MKKILFIAFATALLVGCSSKSDAQSTQAVTRPYAMVDSLCYSVTPYKASSVNQGYAQLDSFAIVNKYTSSNYPYGKSVDTVRFARQRSLMIQLTGSYDIASFQLNVHKDSTGTVNACKAYLEGSNDGVYWTRLNDTMSTTNITNNYHAWVVPTPNKAVGGASTTANYKDGVYKYQPWLFYHILFVGVSTGKVDIHAFAVPRH